MPSEGRPSAQRHLLDLADADAVVARVDHRGKSLRRWPIAELTTKIDSTRDDLVRADIFPAEDLTREVLNTSTAR